MLFFYIFVLIFNLNSMIMKKVLFLICMVSVVFVMLFCGLIKEVVFLLFLNGEWNIIEVNGLVIVLVEN